MSAKTYKVTQSRYKFEVAQEVKAKPKDKDHINAEKYSQLCLCIESVRSTGDEIVAVQESSSVTMVSEIRLLKKVNNALPETGVK